MSARSPLDYDISVTADKRRRARARGLSGETAAEARKCEHQGCQNPGLFRAPKSRENLFDYRWFCEDHIREFNKSWNYFEGWTEEALDAQARAERAWERPTWKFGQRPANGAHMDGRAWAREGFSDPFEVLGEKATLNPGAERRAAQRRRLPKNEESALSILGCEPETPKSDIRKRFRQLVKDLHPDMKGGSREDENRLRDVVWAWDQIKGSRNFI